MAYVTFAFQSTIILSLFIFSILVHANIALEIEVNNLKFGLFFFFFFFFPFFLRSNLTHETTHTLTYCTTYYTYSFVTSPATFRLASPRKRFPFPSRFSTESVRRFIFIGASSRTRNVGKQSKWETDNSCKNIARKY